MKLSSFGERYTRTSGILQLMDDLGAAMSGGDIQCMLGGGNPAHIPEVETYLRDSALRILDSENRFEHMVGDYASPQGEADFVTALATLLREECGWEVGPENIALTNGSQSAFFFLFNMFAGAFGDGAHKKILLPLAPEYIGYADIGLTDDFFVASRPEITMLDDQLFKYSVNFNSVTVTDDVGAICVSRPTNPTGNVLTDEEVAHLRDLARAHQIPLIIDNAYGAPFPNILFVKATPVWDEELVISMSLSKLGLPAARTGIIVANREVIRAVAGLNAVIGLAPGSIGASLACDMMRSGDVLRLSREVIQPYYRRKAEKAVAQLRDELSGYDVHIHKPEGAFFLWLWFRGLPISSQELYERLKARGVLVVPGQYFFPGISEEWRHTQECLRVSYAMDARAVSTGLAIIAQEAKKAYANN